MLYKVETLSIVLRFDILAAGIRHGSGGARK